MAKIKIKDLPKSKKISKAELKNVKGGYALYAATPLPIPYVSNYSFSPLLQVKSVTSMAIDCW